MTDNDLILYSTIDGQAEFVLREIGGQVWLTQLEIAELYQCSKQNISKHIKSIFSEGELLEEAVVNSKLTTAADGKEYLTQLYALPLVLALGYRVRSSRGTQFRQWATRYLAEYMTKGFVMDDERLKDSKWDYFDELLARIRDIRSSEKRFYQKVRDLFTLAEDYQAKEKDTQTLFATVQNKLFYAVTRYTASELIVARADSDKPNMNLSAFKGDRVRKADVVIAKNYLKEDELEHLNRLVTAFFEFAELRAKKKQHILLDDWRSFIDKFMMFTEEKLLKNAGKVSHEQMKSEVHRLYDEFDTKRKRAEAMQADTDELNALDDLEKKLKDKEIK
ncbi:MAG: virulence RhuM family protein [Gammaproteobacteria bacterium]|nr:virulence RhuM family protein [Gammaproteobacteria bacterium]